MGILTKYLIFSLMTALVGMLGVKQAFAGTPYSKNAGAFHRSIPTTKKIGAAFLRLSGNPKVLNPILSDDVDSTTVLWMVFAHLLRKDAETGDYYLELAEKFELSKDEKIQTFTLRKDAVWEDGTPITTDDVEFSFKTLMDPKVEAASKRPYFEGYSFEKVDARTFRFHVERPSVNSAIESFEDFVVIQKKQFEGVPNFNKAKGTMEPVSSGPYRVKSFTRDQKLELELKKDWWGFKVPEIKNQYNFEKIIYRIIPDNSLAYEKFVKGDVDVLEMNSETFGTRVKGSDKDKYGAAPNSGKPLWAKHFMTEARAQMIYVGWNMKRPWFQSKKTRQALAQLVKYDDVMEKVYHGEAARCFAPFGSYTPNTAPDQKSKMFNYNPTKAMALLKEDGWADTDGTGVLSKMIDGKKVKFEFTMRYNSENPMRAKISQMLKEQFKKAGIQVNIQAIEFNALLDAMDNRDYDAVIMGWGRGNINADPKQIWHSKSAENKGSNHVSYSNPEVDRLIDEVSTVLDAKKHFKLNQKIGALIYDDQPYVFLLEVPGFMGGYQNRIKSKKYALRFDDTPPVWLYSSDN